MQNRITNEADTFPLKEMIRIQNDDASRHPLEIEGAIGDGYLLNRFSIFSNLRKAAVELGYKFSPYKNTFGVNSIFPTLELVEIIDKRIVPYRETLLAMEHYLSRDPDFSISKDTFKRSCVGNHVHHECVHALFFEIALQTNEMKGQELVDCLLASESFALAFEKLLHLQFGERLNGELGVVFAANTYIFAPVFNDAVTPREISDRLIQVSREQPSATMMFLTCGYHASLIRPNRQPGSVGLAKWFAEYSGLVGCSDAELDLLLSLCFKVDSAFKGSEQDDFYSFLRLRKELEIGRNRPLAENYSASSFIAKVMPKAIRVLVDSEALNEEKDSLASIPFKVGIPRALFAAHN